MNDKTDSLCRICNQPVDLTFDTATDEDGQAVHDLCYVRKIAAHQSPPEQPVFVKGHSQFVEYPF
jgi:hypothetical protein